jgi:ankyrin repeat protein
MGSTEIGSGRAVHEGGTDGLPLWFHCPSTSARLKIAAANRSMIQPRPPMISRMNITRLQSGLIAFSLLGLLSTWPAQGESASLSPEYFAVLRSGEVASLREALNRGASPNARDAGANTPLMYAATYGNAACVRLLLDRGADVNATNSSGASALLRAAFDYEKLRLLVERGADVNARSALGNTALLLAARTAHSSRSVELLLARGADAAATNRFGSTALMAAVAGGDEQSVRLLLKHGADVNAQPTPDELGFVLGGGRSALMWAAFRGDLAILKLLLDAGADVNAVGGLGTALAQAAWSEQIAAARLLIQRGADVDLAGPKDGYAPLHWAASSENSDPALAKLLLDHGANPNLGGGENVEAFLGTPQTPLMLARRRGETPLVALLTKSGATEATPDRIQVRTPPARSLAKALETADFRGAIGRAVPLLQETAVKSKQAFQRHASRQDCTSCHQQYLPMAAIGFAKKQLIAVNPEAEAQLEQMVRDGEIKDREVDWQPLFHPDAPHTKGYEAFGFAGQELPSDRTTDAWVHHLAAIQGEEGQWHNNLPRPPIQTGDLGATALAVHALQRYPLPGRKAEFARQVNRARQWLWTAKPENNEGRIYQLLGLAWAGESSRKLQSLARALLAEQHPDGGWSQLPGTASDAYATSQAIYALRVGTGLGRANPAIDRGLRFLLQTQLDDGTWHVRRRAFPFQPTMNSGFPHGRDSWISAAATSWAVIALSLPEESAKIALK